MTVLFNDPVRQYHKLRTEIDNALLSTAASGWWISGKQTKEFADQFGKFLGTSNVVPVANGTDSIELCLRAIGIGEGREVITVANAGGYTTTACRLVGGVPVYVDICSDDLLMDIEQIPEALSEKVGAVVVTHLYGNAVDVEKLRVILDGVGRQDIKIVEDCAQAHGAKVGGRFVGGLGDIAAFSFYPTKNLGAIGDAGAVVTNDQMLAERVKMLSQYGWQGRYENIAPYGRNSRMDEVQAAVLNIKLPYLEDFNMSRVRILDKYEDSLPHGAGYRIVRKKGEGGVGHLAVLLCPDREKIIKKLASFEIQTAVHYPVLDIEQPAWKGLPHRVMQIPNSRSSVASVLSLPCYSEMEEDEIETVCQALSSLY